MNKEDVKLGTILKSNNIEVKILAILEDLYFVSYPWNFERFHKICTWKELNQVKWEIQGE